MKYRSPSSTTHTDTNQTNESTHAYHRLMSTSTELHAFLWFGGGNNEDDHQNSTSTNNKNAANSKVNKSLSNIANIMDSMTSFKASQRLGERTGAALQDLSNTLVEGTAANGNVKVTLTAQQVPVGVFIDESYLQSLLGSPFPPTSNNKEAADELSMALTQAMKDAHSKSTVKVEDKLKGLYSDLGLLES